MAHQQNGLFPQSLLKAFTVLILHILLKDVCNGQPLLIGPSQALVSRPGDDVILPCHLEPAQDVSAKTLEWTRSSLDPRFVYVSRGSQELETLKNPSFKGRTSLFVDQLKNGNISLKISKVKFDDTGIYRCYIPDLEKEVFVELVVASVAVYPPVISLSGIDKNRGGVVLQCESAGWYPEPELLWLDGEVKLLTAAPTETLRGPDDLYTVSSRVTVEKRHSNNITCRVQQRNTNQSRETHIHVSEDFFENTTSSLSVIIIGLAVSLSLCIILLILSAVYHFMHRKRKHKSNRRPKDQPDSGDARVPLKKTEREQFNMKGRGKTENQNLWFPITSRKKLEREQQRREEEEQRREEAETKLQNVKEKMINSEIKKAEFIQKLTQIFLTQESKLSERIAQQTELQCEENTETINQLQEVKETAEKLKNQLENKKQEMINSETELDEIIQKLTETFPRLEAQLSGTVSQVQEEKQRMESEIKALKDELDSTKQKLSGTVIQVQDENQRMKSEIKTLKKELVTKEQTLENQLQEKKKRNDETKAKSEKNTETINQLQQEKETAEKLKNQFKSKCHEMINSEKDEIIKKLKETFPTPESKVSESISQQTEWKNNNEIIKQLQEVKQTAETLKNQLESKNQETIRSETELEDLIPKAVEAFLTKVSERISQQTEWKKNTEISKKLEDVKLTAESLKIELESRSREMINSEREKAELIQKLMQRFPTLLSKVSERIAQQTEWKKKNEIIKQLQDVKQTAEKLKNQLKAHEWAEKTETINQLQQLKQAAEILKLQLESKNQQMIRSEMEKGELIQKLTQRFPTLKSKLSEHISQQTELQWKNNNETINQLQEVKQTAEKLEQLELQGKTDTEISKQLQEVKEAAEDLKKQMESKNWEMLQAEKTRKEETDGKLQKLVKQLEEEKKKTEEKLKELVKQLEKDLKEGSQSSSGSRFGSVFRK